MHLSTGESLNKMIIIGSRAPREIPGGQSEGTGRSA